MKRLLRFSLLLAASFLMFGQAGLDPTDILKPLADQWLTYNGDYSGRRYSSLKQINQSNVKDLSLAWVTRFIGGSGPNGNIPAGGGRGGPAPHPVNVGGLGTGDLNTGGNPRLGGGILMVDGVLYMSAPDNAWAVDARDGTILWQYYWKTRGGTHTGNRGMGMWHDNLYLEVHDDYLICLDAHTGKEK
jgi:alcohol dehydrogenase (cytochrome c)